MARLITKFKYLKPSDCMSVGGYAKYIATREGVDKIDDSQKFAPATVKQKELIAKLLKDFPDSRDSFEYEDYQKSMTIGAASEFITHTVEENATQMIDPKTYADYIATRPRAQRFGSHGLFTDDGIQVQLSKVSKELNLHEGNVWTAIISLHREDAERLGYNNGERWRDMLRTQTEGLSSNLHIPMQNLRWFAAFHNESHHSHVHLIAYSVKQSEGYLSKQGVMNLRSSFAKDIFSQDLISVYAKQTGHRDTLKSQSRSIMAEIVAQINSGIYDNPKLESMLTELANKLSKTSGKKVYGYLKADVKDLIDRIVDELATDEWIAKLYDLWYEQQENVIRTYTEALPERVPLSQNKEFKSVRNMVITEAMNIAADRIAEDGSDDSEMPEHNDTEIMPEDLPGSEPTEPDIPLPDTGRKKRNDSWWTEEYKAVRNYLYGTKDTPPDFQKAFEIMQAEALKGNGLAMHDLGKMFLSGLGCDKDETAAQEWFLKAYHAFLAEESRAKKPGYMRYRIGKLFSFGYGVEQDYGQAAQWYERAVEEKNPFAAYSLGSLYRRGQCVDQDDDKAFSLYQMAVEDDRKPNAYAAYELGRMYKDGIGTEINAAESQKWYAVAYNGFLSIEHSMADDRLYYRLGQMNLTGTGTKKDISIAKEYFEKAAALDNADALYGLGKLYLDKESGWYDIEKALDFLVSAAQKGHSYAQYTLGKLFVTGETYPQNADYALYWLEEAAKQDNTDAQCLLGKTLLIGEAIEQDAERAAEKKNSYAAYLAGKIRLTEEAYKDAEKAIRWFQTAAEEGNDFAEYQLGKIYLYGNGVEKDYDTAIRWLTASAEHGNQYAGQLLHSIRSNKNWSAAKVLCSLTVSCAGRSRKRNRRTA